jgi:site-specific recombinase XerD
MAKAKVSPVSLEPDRYEPALLTAMDAFLQSLTARRYSPTSVHKRYSCILRFIHFLFETGIRRYQDVGPAHLNRYHRQLVDQNYSTHSVYAYMASVRLFYRHLEEQSLLFENPTLHITIPKPRQQLGLVLTQTQINTLLHQPDLARPTGLRDRAIIELLYSTGIRLSECTQLTIFDADLDNRTVKVLGKGNKERILPVGKHAAKYLRLYMKEARPRLIRDNDPPEHLWLSHRLAAPMDGQTIRIMLQRHARAAALPKQTDTHTLRRTCATHLLRGGAHPVAVAHLLGHRDLGTLSHYLKTTITDLQQTHAGTKPGK